jgi:hypothetical protein
LDHPQADARTAGSSEQWQRYRERLDGAIAEAVADGTLRSRKELRSVFAALDRETIPTIDPQGRAWLVWHAGTREERRVGVDWSNVRAPESDARFARRLVLARMDAELHGPARARPSLAVFAGEWKLLGALQHEARTENPNWNPVQGGQVIGSE